MPYRLIPKSLRRGIGRRGVILCLFGLAWVIQGLAVMLFGDIRITSPIEPFWHERLNHYLLGTMWLGSGVTSTAWGLTHHSKDDTFGFLAVSAMPMTLAGSYFVGIFTRALMADPSWMLALLGFSVWGVIALALAVIGSWPEPEGDESE